MKRAMSVLYYEMIAATLAEWKMTGRPTVYAVELGQWARDVGCPICKNDVTHAYRCPTHWPRVTLCVCGCGWWGWPADLVTLGNPDLLLQETEHGR